MITLNCQSLEEEIESRATAVTLAVNIGRSLASLTCRAEQASVADKLDLLESRYNEICDRCGRKAALLDQALANARLFGEDEVEVLNWLAEVEDKLVSVSVKDYKRDILQKQHADQMVLTPVSFFHNLFLFPSLFYLGSFHFCFNQGQNWTENILVD